MKKTIAILPGDGIGAEIMAQAVKVLQQIENRFGHEFTLREAPVGGTAWDLHREHLPESTIDICKHSDAILFGSVGGPVDLQHTEKWKDCERNSILNLRKTFHLQFNIRPIVIFKILHHLSYVHPSVFSNEVDAVIVRELIGDIYFGEHKLETIAGRRCASDVMQYDETLIADVARVAFRLARKRRKKVTSVDKANVLSSSRLWRQVVTEIHREFPDCELEHLLVDNCAMQLIMRPSTFDVLLMPNMFGDILSDEASVVTGSVGMLPSASLNKEGFGLFEPISGSVPSLEGTNIANPIGQILSLAMLLDFGFDLKVEADAIYKGVKACLMKGYRTQDISSKDDPRPPIGTKEMGDRIAEEIQFTSVLRSKEVIKVL